MLHSDISLSYDVISSCFFLLLLQTILNEKPILAQTEVKQTEPVMTSEKFIIAKKVHGKELKGPPFISKPQVVIFKVQKC